MGNGLGDSDLKGWDHPAERGATFPELLIDISDLYDYKTWATQTRGWRKIEAERAQTPPATLDVDPEVDPTANN